MEENKNLNPTPEAEEVVAEPKKKNSKPKKEKLLKNEALFKKGTYSIAITAIVLAGILVFNILVSALSERFVLEFDMSADKKNSISEENIDYIKGVESDVEVIVCAAEDYYVDYVGSTAQQSHGVSYDASVAEYYEQTLKLIKKYNAYNKKIDVKFIDPQSSEFSSVTSRFSVDNLGYGDIIVASTKGETTRSKKIGFEDIYVLEEDQTYAMYGMSMSQITGNSIETALTSAVAYVLSDMETEVAILTGHSSGDYTESYKKLLENNNYKVTVLSDPLITKIDDKFDVVVIPGASKDLLESEIKSLSEFLDNEGKLGKGLVAFADASAAYLPNFYEFLKEWGADISEGILFETNSDNHIPDDPTTLGSYNSGEAEDLSKDLQLSITNGNVPMKPAFKEEGYMKATALMVTPESVVAAPKGTTAGWTGANDYEGSEYATAIETVKSTYNDDNDLISSCVTVFSSVAFLNSAYNETASVANKELTLVATERAGGADNAGISFISKSIASESFADSITEASVNAMRYIFMFILPIAVIVVGIVIFVKRRNA